MIRPIRRQHPTYINSSQTQQSQYWAYTTRKPELKETHVQQGSLQHYLQQLGHGEGNGDPFQYSCLENPMDGGDWWAAVYGVAQSRTRLKRLSSSRTWKQPRCLSTDECMRKLWYIYTMEYYSASRRNSFESVLIRWMNLEPIIQSEVSQKEKDKYHILTHIRNLEKWC